jgi:hypothetical protein
MHKQLTINDFPVTTAGIKYGNYAYQCGGGSSTQTLPVFGVMAEGGCFPGTYVYVGPVLKITGGRWYLIEIHVKLNTVGSSNGVMEVWIDDCGTDGRTCPSTQTLRMQRFNVNWGKNDSSDKIASLWWENYNVGSSGVEHFDQIVAATRRIGPMGAIVGSPDTQPPVAPVNLRIQ